MSRAPEQFIADYREAAQALRRVGLDAEAAKVERFLSDVEEAFEPYIRKVGEPDARLVSGKTVSWLRRLFAEWERAGMAGYDERRRRWYRLAVLPRRADTVTAAEQGRQAGIQAARASCVRD